jgi:hypothetical protein
LVQLEVLGLLWWSVWWVGLVIPGRFKVGL